MNLFIVLFCFIYLLLFIYLLFIYLFILAGLQQQYTQSVEVLLLQIASSICPALEPLKVTKLLGVHVGQKQMQALDDVEVLQTAALEGSMLRVWPHHWDTVRTQSLTAVYCWSVLSFAACAFLSCLMTGQMWLIFIPMPIYSNCRLFYQCTLFFSSPLATPPKYKIPAPWTETIQQERNKD